jgi:hypothetical protein
MRRKRWMLVFAALNVSIVFAFLPCFGQVRTSPRWSYAQNDVHQVAIALRNYHEANGHLPPAVVRDKDGKALSSWRVLVLPFLEADNLYRQFHLDESWDSPHNKPLSETAPRPYRSFGSQEDGLTRIQVLIGPGTAFEDPKLAWDDFPDGAENTLLVVEAAEAVPWAKPVDLAYSPDEPLPSFGSGATTPTLRIRCRELLWRPGFAIGLADGSGKFIQTASEERLIRAMITRNGGEKFDVSQLK